jgi:hypothetical protein
MLANMLVSTHQCEKGFSLTHIYRVYAHTFGQKNETNYNAKLENILSVHCTHEAHCWNIINSITDLSKPLNITNNFYICETRSFEN